VIIKNTQRNQGTMISCIVHQENLHAKSFPGFQHVMSVATKVVNFIQSKELNNRQFQNLLSESGAQCDDLIYFFFKFDSWVTTKCWSTYFLSRKCPRFHGIKTEVCSWVSGSTVDVLLWFLVNNIGHLNELNWQRQRPTHSHLYNSMKGFQMKLALQEC
jgi:hypothetical protein